MEEFENIKEFKEITDLIRKTPAVRPSDDFTRRLMGRLPDLKPSVLFRIKHALIRPREFDLDLTRVMAGSAGNSAECAFSFFIVGFFYLTMGLVLFMGLKGFIHETTITQWVKMQPQLIIVTSLWLIIQSVALFLDGKIAVKAAEWGTLVFIGFALINGLMISSNTHLSILFAVAFAGTGLLTGVFLGFTIERYQRTLRAHKGFSG